MAVKIKFRLRGTQQIVYSHVALSSNTQFKTCVLGFKQSPYFLQNRDVQFSYSVNGTPVTASSTRSLADVGLVNNGGFVDVIEQISPTINFRLLGRVVYSHQARTFNTQFRTVINDGFRNSPYYLANRNVLFSYSVNGVNVRADSMLSLTDVGLVNRGFVDLVAKISPTINFRLLGTQQVIYSHQARKLDTQFGSMITNGFRNSPYFLENRNVLFSYSVNGVNVISDSMLSLADVGLVDGGYVDLVAQIFVTINFRLRDRIVYSYQTQNLDTQFRNLIMYGFSNSPYYLANPDVQFSYSVNGVNVLRDSSLSLADVGLVDEGFVDLEIPVTINFRLRDRVVYSYRAHNLETQFRTVIQNGFRNSPFCQVKRSIRYKYFVNGRRVFVNSSLSLGDVGLVNDGFIDVVSLSRRNLRPLPNHFNSFDEIAPIVRLFTFRSSYFVSTKEMSNYLILHRSILKLKFENKFIDACKLLSYVDYSGISQRITEELRKRFNKHGYDEKDFCMIEMIRWNQEMAEAWGFKTCKEAAIAVEFVVSLFDHAFAKKQKPGIRSKDVNRWACNAVFGRGEERAWAIFNAVYEIMIGALIKRDILF